MSTRMSQSAYLSANGRFSGRQSLTWMESVRIYFTILFGVAMSVLVFYYLFP